MSNASNSPMTKENLPDRNLVVSAAERARPNKTRSPDRPAIPGGAEPAATSPTRGVAEEYSNVPGIRPLGLYSVREAAAWLRISNFKSVYEIPESELPQCKVGPKRGRIRYWGADLLCYIRGFPPFDMQSAMEDLRASIARPGASVHAIPSSDPTRVL